MTVSLPTTISSRRLGFALAGLALSAAACADVGSSDLDETTAKNANSDQTICQSIRTTMETDKKAAEAAEAAGNAAEAKRKREAVIAGAQGATSVKGCDVSDLVPASAVPALPTEGGTVVVPKSPTP